MLSRTPATGGDHPFRILLHAFWSPLPPEYFRRFAATDRALHGRRAIKWHAFRSTASGRAGALDCARLFPAPTSEVVRLLFGRLFAAADRRTVQY